MMVDTWSTREQLCLASCVLKHGDIQINWASIVKHMKQICDDSRPKDFYTTKNCADQYFKLLESVSSKRKRTDPTSGSLDSSVLQIVSRLQYQRIEEIKRQVQLDTQQYKKIRKEIDQIESGEFDNQLDSIYEQMLRDGECVDDSDSESESAEVPIKTDSNTGEGEKQSETISTDISAEKNRSEPEITTIETSIDSDLFMIKTTENVVDKFKSSNIAEPTVDQTGSKSEEKQIDVAKEAEVQLKSPLATPNDHSELFSPTKTTVTSPGFLPFNSPTASFSASPLGTEVKNPLLIKSPPHSPYGVMVDSVATVQSTSESPPRVRINTDRAEFESPKMAENSSAEISTAFSEPKSEPNELTHNPAVILEKITIEQFTNAEVKTETIELLDEKETEEKPKTPEPIGRKLRSRSTRSSGRVSVEKPVDEPKKIKLEELDECGSPNDRQRLVMKIKTPTKEKPETPTTRQSKRLTILTQVEDDSSNSSTVEDSAEIFPNTKSRAKETSLKRPLTPHICPPNFPSLDAYKQWKKAIMLVWKTAHNHKYSPTFFHPVEEKNAPGYKSVVKCPMDLTTLRKNVESGVVTSTEQFHREMLLIFVNAIMYNSSKHEVYQMAKEISSEFLRHMQEFLALKTPATTDSSSKSLRHRTAKIELLDDTPRKRRGGTPDSNETSTSKRSRNS